MSQAYCTEQTQNILLGRNNLFYMGSLSRSQLVQMGAEVVSGLLANWAATLKTARIAERKGWLESVLDFDWSSILVRQKKTNVRGPNAKRQTRNTYTNSDL